MNKPSLAPTASHAKYMDFIAPKKKPIPVGRPTSEVTRKPSVKSTKPVAKPVIKKSIAKPLAKPTKPATKPVEKPVQKSASTPVKVPAKVPAKAPTKPPVKAAKPAPQPKDEAPDAAKYTLGGKSPFLATVTVEKRPLSSSVPEIPAKNIYPETKKPELPTKSEPTKIISKKQKSSGGLSFAIILLTILLGAVVGVVAYYILPK